MSKTTPLPPVTLVLGGARSGKSSYAETLVERSGLAPVYLATAEAFDDEMAERIREHQVRRGDRWRTVEEPLALSAALDRESKAGTAILVDCLTLWLSNLMVLSRDIDREMGLLVTGLTGIPGPVVFVSNEVGLGIVPSNDLGREFRDHAGRLNQAVAAVSDRVVLLVAGLPFDLKPAA